MEECGNDETERVLVSFLQGRQADSPRCKSHRPEGAHRSTPSFKGSREVEPSAWVSVCPVTPAECGRLRGRVVVSRTGISLIYRWGDTGLEATSLAYSNRVDGKVGFVATPFAFRVCPSMNGNFFT